MKQPTKGKKKKTVARAYKINYQALLARQTNDVGDALMSLQEQILAIFNLLNVGGIMITEDLYMKLDDKTKSFFILANS